ncbi:MAG: adenylate/guanylate cyclase domain-containing protein, partial [Bacteroidetes bacterium]|nr:adenylate/guanylate cyclase domain-containing protein [Bacteroidota bacterium]
MFTDIVGYTALMGKDEQKALKLLEKNQSIQRNLIEQYHGKLLKEMADGLMSSFNSVIDAVQCAIGIQIGFREDVDLNIKIGIHLGDVLFKEGDIFGDGVNIASRIEALAQKGEILVSESVYLNVKNQQGIHTEFVREEHLKNVEEPVKIYKVEVQKSLKETV